MLRRRPRHRDADRASLTASTGTPSASRPGASARSRGIRAGLGSALIVLLVTACGGGDDDAVSTSGPLVPSQRDYVVQADTICIRGRQAIEAEAETALGIDSRDFTVAPSGEITFKPGRAPAPERIERFGTEVVLPTLREQLAGLRALTPPEGDEAVVAEIYDTAERGLDRLAADPSQFNDRAAVRRELGRARRLGRRYGFFECGSYSGP